jgi:hypothetical protein
MVPPKDVPDPDEPTTIEPPACRPPLELVEGGSRWVLEAYNRGYRDGETYSTHDSQMEAMRAGKRRMDANGHPCLLRWESDDSVGTMYWNPAFERLDVRRDSLTGQWVVVPERGYLPFYATDRQELAVRYGREVQRAYDFKHLDLYTERGQKRRTIDHRFLRHEIDSSGVTFKRDAITGEDATDPLAEDDEEADEAGVPTETTPASALAAAVPDLTDIEVLLTEGPIHYYRAGWTDDEDALIAILDPDQCGDRSLVDAFLDAVEGWETVADTEYVATVHDQGIGPSPWVAYAAGEGALPELLDDLTFRARMRIADDVASAYGAATLYDVPRRGADPSNVRVVTSRGQKRGRLADWGLTRAVLSAAGDPPVTHYTAPEELDGEETARTAVYHLGALTYYLAAERAPFADARELPAAVRAGDPTPPSRVSGTPSAVDDVVLRAMATDPAKRFGRVGDFRDALDDVL